MKYRILLGVIGLAFLTSCKKASCDDGKLNQDESAIDCGGICAPCPSCSDGVKNQDEVEIDCGGACPKCPIYFPESGSYGTNILNSDSVNLIPGNYSMRAEVPQGSSFKAILYNVSGGAWFYNSSTQTNIVIGTITSSQQFEALQSGIMQVEISLSGSGNCLIQYFENSTAETKTKTIIW